jgi:hypothetical protein
MCLPLDIRFLFAKITDKSEEKAKTMSALSAPTAYKLDAVHTLLRARRLDRTLAAGALSTAWPAAPFAAEALTDALRGGIPRGQLSEIHGPVSSGRTSLAWGALAAATARGEWAALIDTFDRLDPSRATEAGVMLSGLLWVRGQALSKTSGAIDPAWIPGERSVHGPGTLLERTIDRAIKAFNLVAQSGVCTMVVLDLVDVPETTLAHVPRSTWLRLQRIVEGTEVALLLMAAAPVARSAGGLSIAAGVAESGPGMRRTGGTAQGLAVRSTVVRWKGAHERARRLGGLRTQLRATSPRGYVGELPLAIG